MIALNKIEDPRTGAMAWEILYLPDSHIKLTPSEEEFIHSDTETTITQELEKIMVIAEAMEKDDEFHGIQIKGT